MKKIYTLCLVMLLMVTQTYTQSVSIIATNSAWKYLDNGSNQGTAWRSSSFNDASWATGNAQLGYGDGDETTVVSFGPSATNKYRTTYFRKSFSVANPAIYTSFTLGLLRDDGAVVYLNGAEIARSNMPTGTISYTTFASTSVTGAAESTYYNFSITPSQLAAGTNVLAVEVHQRTAANVDLSFDLKLDATLTPACGTPSSLTSSAVTTSSATVSWAAVTGATSYNIQYRIIGTTAWSSTTSSTTAVALSGLQPSSTYEFRVQAVCAVTGAFSGTATFTTLAIANDTLINTNANWKYLDNGTNQGTAWRGTSFNDATWLSGNAELGYGDGGEATLVGYGPSATAKYITTYFRKSFTVTSPAAYPTLSLDMVRDDGVVVYINGTEVYRNNMPTGTIAYNTLATAAIGGTDESAWNTAVIPSSALVAGNNVMAVEIHQNAATSSDISFNARFYKAALSVTRGAYLQKLSPTSVTIRWRTNIACDSKVQFGNSLSYGNSVTDANLVTEHIVTLNGLNPAANYFYSIGTTTQLLQGDAKNNFYTAPLPGSTTPVRIWATGDFGNGSTQQIAVRDAYVNYTGATPTNVWVWMGDNAYNNGTDTEYQNYVFTKYPDQLKSYPLFPSPGNHDYGSAGYQSASALTTNFAYFNSFSVPQAGEAGGVPSGTPKYYSFNHGNIHFISLDSYGALNNTTSPMYTWLQNDLAANTQRWTIVYFHHAPYTKGTHNSDTEIELVNMRTNIVPLLENYHVDLVLTGHSHVNERSYLIKGHYGLANSFTSAMKVSTATNTFTKSSPFDGTIYAVCGTSGQNPGSIQAGYPMPCMHFSNNTNNCSMVIDVAGDNLSARFLTSAGAIVDQFTINKVGARMANPLVNTTNFWVQALDDEFTINYFLEEDASVSVTLLDVMGKQLFKFNDIPPVQPKGHYSFELPVTEKSLISGVYLVRIIMNGKAYVKKVVVP